MRKQLYAVAAAILAAGMLAGCSGGAKETEEQRPRRFRQPLRQKQKPLQRKKRQSF